MMRALMLAFAAGCGGALVNSLAVWAAGHWGITALLGVHIAPALTAHWLYPRIVWGGLWGLLFALPWKTVSPVRQGLGLSLFPTLAQLFVFFPRGGKGMAGLDLGALTPLAVIVFNAIWGLSVAWLLRRASGRGV